MPGQCRQTQAQCFALAPHIGERERQKRDYSRIQFITGSPLFVFEKRDCLVRLAQIAH